MYHQISVIVEVVAATTDEVHSAVNLTVLKIGPMPGHLSVLSSKQEHVLHHGLVASIDGYGYTTIGSLLVLQGLVVVQVVQQGEVLQVEACAVAQVDSGIADTTALSTDDDAIAALTDERDVIAADAQLVEHHVVVAILQEDGLTGS